MKNELLIQRIPYIDSQSTQISNDDAVFPKLFHTQTELKQFMHERMIPETTVGTLLKKYDTSFFAVNTLIVMISNERSGSSQLRLENIFQLKGKVFVILKRKRGLTMDMASLLICLSLPGHESSVCSAVIENDDAEALLF